MLDADTAAGGVISILELVRKFEGSVEAKEPTPQYILFGYKYGLLLFPTGLQRQVKA
jgi:hypothetical protein